MFSLSLFSDISGRSQVKVFKVTQIASVFGEKEERNENFGTERIGDEILIEDPS